MTYAHDAWCNTIHEAGPDDCPPAREETDLNALAGITEFGVVRPGDKLLLHIQGDLTPSHIARLSEQMQVFLPGVQVAYVGGGVERVVIVRGEAAS